MIKKGVVTQAQANGTWEGKFGVMYKHEITFDNGDSGEYSSKSQDQTKFVVGQETEYEFIDGKFPKIKPVNTFQQGNFTPKAKDDVQEYIVKQSSLKCATDFVIANGGDVKSIIDTAEIFTNWVLKGEKPGSNNIPF
tara:strand:+ start:100 stop:510 length:411 start_codon:yes stop_codon:yes gene_type:complete